MARGGFTVNVSSDLRRLQRRIGAYGDQVPFAAAGALNDTAFGVRHRMVNKSWPRAVVVRNKRFLGVAMRVDKANKSTLTAVIYDRLKSRAISDQATGGTRKARGRNLAIPSTFVEGKRGRRGVPKALRPRTQLGRKRTFVAKDANSGQLMILRRKGRGRYPLQVLYVLENTAHIPKRWRPEEDAIITLRRDFARHFVKRWRQAMRTRR